MSINVCSQFGAHGDALAAPEGSVYACAGCATLHADGPLWAQNDVGKLVSVRRAGPTALGPWGNPFNVPHVATITAVAADGKSLTMSAPAANAVNPSPRVVWGHDDTAAIQQALDAAAGGADKFVIFPSGAPRFLVRELRMHGSASEGPRDYSGLILHGQGRDATALEGFDPDYAGPDGLNRGLLAVGELPYNPQRPQGLLDPAYRRVEDISVTGIEFRQVEYARLPTKCLYTNLAKGMVVRDCRFADNAYEGLYTGGGESTVTLVVEDCEAVNVGHGGPYYQAVLSGFNVNSYDVSATRCVARDCGQGFESGAHNVRIYDCEVRHSTPGAGRVGVNIGSTGSGISNVVVERCRFFGSSVGAGPNGIGTLASVHVRECEFVDGCLSFAGGTDGANPNQLVRLYSVPRGPSYGPSSFARNRLRFTQPYTAAAPISYQLSPDQYEFGMASLDVTDNEVRYDDPGLYLVPWLQILGPVGGRVGTAARVLASRNRVVGTSGPSARGMDVAVYSYRTDPAYPPAYADRAFVDAGDNDYGGREGVVAVYT